MPISPKLIFFLCIIFCGTVAAQSRSAGASGEFVPVPADASLLSKLSNDYQLNYKEELTHLPSVNKKDYQDIYDERWKSIKERFDKQEIYTDATAQAYLDALVAAIVSRNALLKAAPFHCYFSRSQVPNAEYIGEGIILFNMGLFDRLSDESQVAYILCHEISHFLLHHQDNSIARQVETLNSPEFQAKLKAIQHTEFNKRTAVEGLAKGLAFDSRRHSRDHEAQADSMAVVLMRATKFDLNGALTTLALLDTVDKDDFNTAASLQLTFNSTAYPFKKKWLKKEDGLLGGHTQPEKSEFSDSLKTHPSCPLRIKLLTPMVQSWNTPDRMKNVVDVNRFDELRERFKYETIEYAYASEDYSGNLFYSLELLHDRPNDPYLIAGIGRVLNGIYDAQKGHRLSKVVDLPGPGNAPNYNLLLQFIQNLYLEDWASINYNFLTPWHPRLDHLTVFKTAYEQSARMAAL
jgi:Zn-dependent protease with chaperone function